MDGLEIRPRVSQREKKRTARRRSAGISYARSYLEDKPETTRDASELRPVLSHGLYDGRHDDAERVLEQLRANV